jgi:hypothetical protein
MFVLGVFFDRPDIHMLTVGRDITGINAFGG